MAILPGSGLGRQELVLNDAGESLAPIVVCQEPPPATRRVADELATYIDRTSRSRP